MLMAIVLLAAPPLEPAERQPDDARNRLTAELLVIALAAFYRSASKPAETVVLIGHAGPLTGSIAHQGKDDENGVALALEQANAKGLRIGGQTVTFRMMR